MRKKIIAGNWKMNMNCSETTKLCEEIKNLAKDINDVDIVVCPPFTSIGCATLTLKDTNIKVGAQNMYIEDSGAFTGEISPMMLKELGVTYVILGHSERRQYFKESDEFINKKAKKALSVGLIPIICVGETLEQREKNKTKGIVKKQVTLAFQDITPEEAKKIIVAYEPVWAIGTGKTATPEQAQEVHKIIRNLLKKLYSKEISQEIRIQYGGSMKPENAKELQALKDIDGGLIGGASLKADSFLKIVKPL